MAGVKILRNDTVSSITITDTGVTILPGAANKFTIPTADYHLWAGSSDVVAFIGDGDLVVEDGTVDLSISDGMDLIKSQSPREMQIVNATRVITDVIDVSGIKRLAVDITGSVSGFPDEKVKVTSNDTTADFLLSKVIAADESNTTNILEIKEVGDGGDEDLKIAIDESKIDHGALAGLADDDHTQYVLRSILTTKGDLFVRNATVITRIGVGTNGQVLTADSAVAEGVKWAAAAGGVSGSGTDNHIVRWDGTSDIQDSGVVLDDSDHATGYHSIEWDENADTISKAALSKGKIYFDSIFDAFMYSEDNRNYLPMAINPYQFGHWTPEDSGSQFSGDGVLSDVKFVDNTSVQIKDTTNGYALEQTTSAVSGNDAFIQEGGDNITISMRPFMIFKFKINQTTDCRFLCGIWNSGSTPTILDADDPGDRGFGIRYSSASDTNWRFLSRSNTTLNNVDTGVAVSTNVLYLMVNAITDTDVDVTLLDNKFVELASTTFTTNLPTSTEIIRPFIGITTLTSATKSYQNFGGSLLLRMV